MSIFLTRFHFLTAAQRITQNGRLGFSTLPLTRLKATFQSSVEDRKNFDKSTCQLTISVGQQAHEGEKFSSAVELVNRSFHKVVMMVDDSLQWYSLGIGRIDVDQETLIKEAVKQGDEWLERNYATYSKLTIPLKIVRWKDWMNNPEFPGAKLRMRELYFKDAQLKLAIDSNVNVFLERYRKNHGLSPDLDKRAVELCTEYLWEECGVMKEFWPSLGAQYEVYPSKRSIAMDAVYTKFIQPYYPDLLKPVSLRFNRRNIELPIELPGVNEENYGLKKGFQRG